MWKLSVTNHSGSDIQFTDGIPGLDAERGGENVSSRLIVLGQGIIDITDCNPKPTSLPSTFFLDVNGVRAAYLAGPPAILHLTLTPFAFTFSVTQVSPQYVGVLKPLPSVSEEDATFLDKMIAQKYVPYQDMDANDPGKTEEELRVLGKQFFPFTPNGFQLAISVYDWTSASFARMVFMKIYEYTSIPQNPFPLGLTDIAKAIWDSNWGSCTPDDPYYMNSFMMKPAKTLEDVSNQLSAVYADLQNLSAVQNRLLRGAFAGLPRTCVFDKPQLFSGQVDIRQLGMSAFGIQFLESSLNKGPVGTSLQIPFAEALASSYMQPGSVITSKMVYSFTDSFEDAVPYSNGIILIANPPGDSVVWEDVAYITPLSVNPQKIEYTFAPGTSFIIESITAPSVTIGGQQKNIHIITLGLQSKPPRPTPEPSTAPATLTDTSLDAPVSPPPITWDSFPATLIPEERLFVSSGNEPSLQEHGRNEVQVY